MLGKVSNSLYYRLPIKVDFTKAFNMKASHNIFKVIFKYFCQIRFCCNYFINFTKDYFFILENFISKVRLNSFPEMFAVCNFFHVEIIIEILFWSLENFNAVVTLPFVCQLIFWAINFLSLLGRSIGVMTALLSSLFINTAWLHLIRFSFSGAWEFNSFEATNLNLSNSLGWTLWKDNSYKRSLLKCSLVNIL